MNKPTRVKYLGVEEVISDTEIILMFQDEEGNKLSLLNYIAVSIALEQAEELWNDLEDVIFSKDN